MTVTGTVIEELVVSGLRIELERPSDAESLIDEEAFADDEFLPYWAEQWPSGVALAEHVARLSELAGLRVFELGCGLGIPSLVAARCGADVVATDWSSDAIALLERNATRNGARLTTLAVDWRDPEPCRALGPFDLVLAADVLYEERNTAPVLDLLSILGVPALVADPGRRHAETFFARAIARGWSLRSESHSELPRGGIHRLDLESTL